MTLIWSCHPMAADDEIALIAEPSDIFGTNASARWRAPTKLTRIVSHSLEGRPGQPGAAEQSVHRPTDRSGDLLDVRAIA